VFAVVVGICVEADTDLYQPLEDVDDEAFHVISTHLTIGMYDILDALLTTELNLPPELVH
jgi:hypothetical protein